MTSAGRMLGPCPQAILPLAGDFGSYHAEPIDLRSGVSEPSIFVFPYGTIRAHTMPPGG